MIIWLDAQLSPALALKHCDRMRHKSESDEWELLRRWGVGRRDPDRLFAFASDGKRYYFISLLINARR